MARSLDEIWGAASVTAVPETPVVPTENVKPKRSLDDIWGSQPVAPKAKPSPVAEPVTSSLPEKPSAISEDIPISIPKLSEDPEVAKLESQFYSAQDPELQARALKSFPEDKGKELLSSLPEVKQAPVFKELQNLINEDRKGNAFALGILESTPIPTFFPEEAKEELQKTKEAAPVASAAGQIAGTIGQAILGGQAIGGALGKLKPIANSPLLRSALTRLTTSGVIAAEQNIGRKEFGEAVKDVAQQSGGGLLSLVPEIIAPPGVAQAIAQPLTDLVYDVATDKIRGKDVGTKEWWKNEIISLASSAGFAIKDAASGKTFAVDQAAQREELKNFLGKNKDAEIEIVQQKPLPEPPAPAEPVRPEAAKPEGAEQRIAEELQGPAEVRPSPVEKIESMEAEPSPLTMGGLAAGQELPSKAGNINLEKIDAGYDPKRVILETSADYEGKIDEARRGKITQEETRSLADDLGMTEKQLLRRKRGEAFNAEQVLAARDLLNSSAQRVVEQKTSLAEKRASGTLTDQDLADFSLELRKHAAIQAEVAGLTAEAGRALNSFKIMSEAKKKAASADEILNAAGGKAINEDILDKLEKIDPENTAALNKFIQKSIFAKTTDAIYEAWINSILSAPTTHLANITSNLATGLYRTVAERPAAAAIDRIVSRAQKRPVKRFFGEMPAELYGFAKGLPEGWAAFRNTWKTGVPAEGAKIETARHQEAIPGKAGRIIRTPTRLLSSADEFFKTVIYRGTMQSLAYRKARAEGKKGAELQQRVNEILKDPTKTMSDTAKKEAQYRTFTNPLGKVGNGILKLRQDTPGLKYIVPFIKTPTNIAKFALKRMPVTSQAILLNKLNKGEIKDAQLSDEIAKGAAGSALAMLTVALARDGMVTGGGPKEKNERDALYRTGWLPYSLKIGDKYYAYGRLEPLASVLGTAADFATMDIDKMSDNQIADITSKIAYSFGKNITSKTFMQGISDMIDVVSDPARYGQRFINQRIGSLVPNVVAATARATDDELKQVRTIGETIMSRIPGLSHEVLARRDLWGQPIKKAATGAESLLSPFQISEDSKDKVDQEMLRVKANVGMPTDKFQVRGRSIKLDPDLYDRYTEATGKASRSKIERLMRSRKYLTSSDEGKKDLIRDEFVATRRKLRKRFLMTQLRRK